MRPLPRLLCFALGIASGATATSLLPHAGAEDAPKPNAMFSGALMSKFTPFSPEESPEKGIDAITLQTSGEAPSIVLYATVDDGEETMEYTLEGSCGGGRFWATTDIPGGLIFVTGAFKGTEPRRSLKATGYLVDGAGIDLLKVVVKEFVPVD